MLKKLGSRKLWIAVASATVAALHGNYDLAAQIVIAYIVTQGVVDYQAEKQIPAGQTLDDGVIR